MVFAEAMAHGLPLIATTAGAIPETVSPEAALFVPPGDSAALTRALRRVISEPALAARLAAGSRAAGGRLPEWPKATEEWERALDRATWARSSRGRLWVHFRLCRPASGAAGQPQ
jgi:glycosyltransferase involved in cell wall biosynthesis